MVGFSPVGPWDTSPEPAIAARAPQDTDAVDPLERGGPYKESGQQRRARALLARRLSLLDRGIDCFDTSCDGTFGFGTRTQRNRARQARSAEISGASFRRILTPLSIRGPRASGSGRFNRPFRRLPAAIVA